MYSHVKCKYLLAFCEYFKWTISAFECSAAVGAPRKCTTHYLLGNSIRRQSQAKVYRICKSIVDPMILLCCEASSWRHHSIRLQEKWIENDVVVNNLTRHIFIWDTYGIARKSGSKLNLCSKRECILGQCDRHSWIQHCNQPSCNVDCPQLFCYRSRPGTHTYDNCGSPDTSLDRSHTSYRRVSTLFSIFLRFSFYLSIDQKKVEIANLNSIRLFMQWFESYRIRIWRSIFRALLDERSAMADRWRARRIRYWRNWSRRRSHFRGNGTMLYTLVARPPEPHHQHCMICLDYGICHHRV